MKSRRFRLVCLAALLVAASIGLFLVNQDHRLTTNAILRMKPRTLSEVTAILGEPPAQSVKGALAPLSAQSGKDALAPPPAQSGRGALAPNVYVWNAADGQIIIECDADDQVTCIATTNPLTFWQRIRKMFGML
jgi:hypothetical protein